MKRIVYIGPLGGTNGANLNNGASIKNFNIVNRLKELKFDIQTIDTQHWKKNPKIILKLLSIAKKPRNTTYIISTSFKSAYYLLKFLSCFIKGSNIYYWVIGGALAQKIESNHFDSKIYSSINKIIVEGEQMKIDLAKLGINNSIVIPNFKNIPNLPVIKNNTSDKINFVFLSRIIPEKGCNLIFDACKTLNSMGLKDKYSISFYGPIDSKYRTEFDSQISQCDNLKYNGFLDLNIANSYNVLAEYDVFLFPTYWSTEGFPGVIIDAYISGLPIIASDWNLNKHLIIEGETGYIIPPKSHIALSFYMQKAIENKNTIYNMRKRCQEKAKDYSIKTAISINNLKRIGLY